MNYVSRMSSMEFTSSYRLPSPQMGTWLSEDFEQDFCYGAKASTSQNPVFSTPPGGSWTNNYFNDVSDWDEQTSSLKELIDLESFPDVVLQDNYFGPEDLLGDLNGECHSKEFDDHEFLDASSQELAATPISDLFLSPPESPQSQKLPTVKIKLKRIKRPKTLKNSQNSLQKPQPKNNYEYEVIGQTSFTSSENTNAQSLDCENKSTHESACRCEPAGGEMFLHDDFACLIEPFKCAGEISLTDNELSFEPSAPELLQMTTPSPEISLRDAIDMGEADDFLDDLLNSSMVADNSESQTYHEESDLMEEDISSPLSSVSVKSFLPSPVFDYSDQGYSSSVLDTIDSCVLSEPDISEEKLKILHIKEKAPKSQGDRFSVGRKPSHKLPEKSRYLRKKEQNKQAALRYRLKRKQEDHSLTDTLRLEDEQQEKLKKEFRSIKQEISIMKKLLREAFIAKQLVPENFFSKNAG